jgi:ABC-type amino acid transport substrate-binding protein
MGPHSFAGLGGRLSLRLAAVICAVAVSASGASAQSSVPSDSRLKSIIAKKVIRIAYRADDRPFSFVNDAKEPLGYTIDLCKQVTTSIAEQFKVSDLKIEWVPVTVETRFSAVAGNKADIECGSSTVTLGRMKEVDFSILTFVESTGILVSRTSNIHGLADLGGKKIALVTGTSNERAVSNIVTQLSILVTLVPVKDRDEGVAAISRSSNTPLWCRAAIGLCAWRSILASHGSSAAGGPKNCSNDGSLGRGPVCCWRRFTRWGVSPTNARMQI